MIRFYILILIISSTISASAKVEHASFYFEESNEELTAQSEVRLQEFKEMLELYHAQIIEVNAYSDKASGMSYKELSQKRAESVLNYLELEQIILDDIAINTFGKKKVLLNFQPENWNRIDIYYFVGELKAPPIIIEIETEVDTVVIEEETIVIEEEVDENKLEIVEGAPIIFPIKFEGGTSKVLPESYDYMEQLFQAMQNDIGLKVQIDGHVCCKNKMRASKKRAKTVYKYLVKKGIDKKRISYQGFSNKKPLIKPERTKEDRATNRRVEITFSR